MDANKEIKAALNILIEKEQRHALELKSTRKAIKRMRKILADAES